MTFIPSPWRICLLGELSAQRAHHAITRFRTRKTGSVLGYLALNMNQSHPRDALAEQFWPDLEDERARHNLRQALSSLRHQLEPPELPKGSVIVSTNEAVRLHSASVVIDVLEFGKLLQIASDLSDHTERIRVRSEAVDMYGGPLLPACLDDWVQIPRREIGMAYLAALKGLAADLEGLGDRQSALSIVLRAATAEPERSQAHFDAIRLYAELGRTDEAHRHYNQHAAYMRREWDRAPAAQIQRLIARLPAQTPSPTSSYKLGERRGYWRRPPALPVNVLSQVADTERAVSPGLPLALTRFFGREKELAELLLQIAPSERTGGKGNAELTHGRLVTITGCGGAGKTRLAVEAASHLVSASSNSVCFVALADLRKADEIPGAIRNALRARRPPKVSALEQALAVLNRTPTVLVLDNMEHLLPAAADVVLKLLSRARNLTCLVTSRTCLNLDGEAQLKLLPFSVPTAVEPLSSLLAMPVLQMFVDRAQAVKPDFQVTERNAAAVSEVCRWLEGVPLAIELAAAHAHALTPDQMLSELQQRHNILVTRRRNVDPRHQTFRTTLEWSAALLPAPARKFLAALSLFQGGFTYEAADTVCGEGETLHCLETLIESSLVYGNDYEGTMRYRMLESVRDYAGELLVPVDRDRMSKRHTEYYACLAQRLEQQLTAGNTQDALNILEAEYQNIKLALEALEQDRSSLPVAAALRQFWLLRGYANDGRQRLTRALSDAPTAGVTVRIAALTGLAALERQQGDLAAAVKCCNKSLSLSRDHGDILGTAEALNQMAIIAFDGGNLLKAQEYNIETLALRRAAGDNVGAAGTLNNLGRIAEAQRDFDTAAKYFNESAGIFHTLGDKVRAAIVLCNLGVVACESGDYSTARASYERSLSLSRETGNRPTVAVLLYNLGDLHYKTGNTALAGQFMRQSIVLRRELGDTPGQSSALSGLASIAARAGDVRRAATLLAAGHALRTETGTAISGYKLQDFKGCVQTVRSALSRDEFQLSWQYGLSMNACQAVEYALEMENITF